MEAISLSNRLQTQYIGILNSLSRLKRNSSNVFIAKKDFDIFYEGTFLRSVTSFEAFVEELFIGLLYDKYELPANHQVQKIKFESRKLVLNYLLNGKKYLDLLPYDSLVRNMKVFYNDRNPFKKIDSSDQTLLKHIFIIRNSIAHNSVSANLKFQRFIDDYHPTLPLRDRNPTKFLQSLHSPGKTMFEYYLIELNSLANKISTYNG